MTHLMARPRSVRVEDIIAAKGVFRGSIRAGIKCDHVRVSEFATVLEWESDLEPGSGYTPLSTRNTLLSALTVALRILFMERHIE